MTVDMMMTSESYIAVQPKPMIPAYVTVSANGVTQYDTTTSTRQPDYVLKSVRLGPVYVTKDNKLVYNSSMMERGRKYYVSWCGEHFALVKEDSRIRIYRFEPEGD